MTDLFKSLGVEISLAHPDDFLKVRETLTRIGIASSKDKKLFQSCHIFHKRGRYAIMHFKELFIFDGKPSNIDEDDIARRNTIVDLLVDWKLVVPEEALDGPRADIASLKIIAHSVKKNWELVSKYTIGK